MLKIQGYSDDIISVEGDVDEEFNSFDEGTRYLALSNGVIVSALYDDEGFWRFHIRENPKNVEIEKHEGKDEDSDYSDILTVKDTVEWVTFGKMKRGKK